MNSCVITKILQSRHTVGFVVLFTVISLIITSIFILPAAASELYPDRTDNLIFDETETLTASTAEHIADINRALLAMTGAEIGVVIVKNTGAATIDEYAVGLFNEWGLGCRERNNGVLLLISDAKREFMAIQGSGITDLFSSNKLKSYLNEYMAVSFDAGDTDTGVLKTFDVIAAYLESIYAVDTDDYSETFTPLYTSADIGGTASESGVTSDKQSLTDTVFNAVKVVFFVLLLLAAVIAVFLIARSVLLTREERRKAEKRKAAQLNRENNTMNRQMMQTANTNVHSAHQPNTATPIQRQQIQQNNQNPTNHQSHQIPYNQQNPQKSQYQKPVPKQNTVPKRKSTIEGIDTDSDGLS